jgi:hypothetical protein
MPFAFLTRNSPCRGSHVQNPAPLQPLCLWIYSVGIDLGIAAAIASFPLMASSNFVLHWLQAWLFSWLLMLPVVLLAAPAIRRLAHAVTTEE